MPRQTRRALLRGAPAAAVLAAMPALAANTGPNPDAELIAWCEQHAAAHEALNTYSGDMDDMTYEHPLWVAYFAACDAISDARPQTIAGVLAKARAAHVEALRPDGTYDPDHCPAETWAWGIAQDVLRLAGAA